MKQTQLLYLIGLIIQFWSLNLFGSTKDSFQNLPPTCNGSINISQDADCLARLTPDVLLEAPDNLLSYRIFITSPTNSTGNYLYNGTDSVTLLRTGNYEYLVTDNLDRTCSGKILVEDKLAPVFTSLPRDTFVNCSLNLAEGSATNITATDNCGAATVSYVTSIVESGDFPCDTSVVAVLWKATDESGNSRIDTQRIVYIKPSIDQLVIPEDVVLSCGEDDLSDIDNLAKTGTIGIQHGQIVNSVFIPSDTISLDSTDAACGLGFNLVDNVVNADCKVKAIRQWVVFDWCMPAAPPTTVDTQIIEFRDTIAPVFDSHVNGSLSNPKRVELGDNCRFDIELIDPTATDNCDTTVHIEMYEVAQMIDGIWNVIGENVNTINLSADTFRLGYRAFDDCHAQLKEDSIYTYLLTTDLTAPTVICVSDLVVSIAGEQGVLIDAETIDGGSYDACGILTKEIRLNGIDTTWSSSRYLPCSLISKQVMVELRVTDAAGNENFCWTFVSIEDKLSPICQPLLDSIVTCDVIQANDYGASTDINHNGSFDDAEWTDLTGTQLISYNETFGDPICSDNVICKPHLIEQEYQRIENPCGMAQIIRRYRGKDSQRNYGDWVEQRITVNYTADWSIKIAPDWEGTCNDIVPEPFIDIQNGACNNLSVNITERRFVAQEDYCVKVERTYQIINNCIFNGVITPFSIPRVVDLNGTVVDTLHVNSTTLGTESHLTYRQILYIRSTDRPNLVMGTVEACISEHDPTASGIIGSCTEERTFTASATDCIGDLVSNYEWLFYANDTLVDRGTGNSFTKEVEAHIDYSVQFIATDNCNNQAEEIRDFVFTDCVKPTLFTRTGIALELKEREAFIRATDFDIGSVDNCTDRETLLRNFRIWHIRLGGNIPTDIDVIRNLPTSLTLTCAEIGSQEIFLYVFDEAGNFDRTENFVIVQDNQESCTVPPGPSVCRLRGNIRNEDGSTIEQVAVILTGEMEEEKMTDEEGLYTFDIPAGGNYFVEPTKLTEPLNGVTTFDLILISKHILGITPFDSPYQYIAADINKSGTISAYDLVQLRQLILDITTDFSNNNSWRFVSSDYQFTTENPASEDFVERKYIDDSDRGLLELDFVGVKIGDINGTAVTNNFMLASSRTSAKPFNFNFENQLLKVGEEIEIPFYINNLEEIEGLQFALNLEGLQLIDVKEGLANHNHINSAVSDRGKFAISWNKSGIIDQQAPLFTLTLVAQKSGWLSNLLSINNDRIVAEAYSVEDDLYPINLLFGNSANTNAELFQNKPNPFNSTTIIPFHLQKEELVSLKVMDIQGKILHQINGTYESGMHEISIDKEQLNSTGILYYQLTAGSDTFTKKMILLD